jgi:hypothetical protein
MLGNERRSERNDYFNPRSIVRTNPQKQNHAPHKEVKGEGLISCDEITQISRQN